MTPALTWSPDNNRGTYIAPTRPSKCSPQPTSITSELSLTQLPFTQVLVLVKHWVGNHVAPDPLPVKLSVAVLTFMELHQFILAEDLAHRR